MPSSTVGGGWYNYCSGQFFCKCDSRAVLGAAVGGGTSTNKNHAWHVGSAGSQRSIGQVGEVTPVGEGQAAMVIDLAESVPRAAFCRVVFYIVLEGTAAPAGGQAGSGLHARLPPAAPLRMRCWAAGRCFFVLAAGMQLHWWPLLRRAWRIRAAVLHRRSSIVRSSCSMTPVQYCLVVAVGGCCFCSSS
jgi:hypothetical protein